MRKRLNPIVIKKIDESNLQGPIKEAIKNILEKQFEYIDVHAKDSILDPYIKSEIENAYIKMKKSD